MTPVKSTRRASNSTMSRSLRRTRVAGPKSHLSCRKYFPPNRAGTQSSRGGAVQSANHERARERSVEGRIRRASHPGQRRGESHGAFNVWSRRTDGRPMASAGAPQSQLDKAFSLNKLKECRTAQRSCGQNQPLGDVFRPVTTTYSALVRYLAE